MSRLVRFRSRLRSDQRGGVAITFAILATALFGAIALAVDVARGQNLSARLSAALDAAAMAGAKALDRGEDDAQVQLTTEAFFNAQLANQRIHAVTISPLKVTIDREKGAVDAAVDANMGTTFGAIIGKASMEFAKSSGAVLKARDIEFAMALDVTGSMLDGTKLADLRSAAKDVLDTLFSEAKTDKSVRVSLIPWAAAVNAGSLASSVSTGSADGCVVERVNGQINDADPSGSNALRAVTAPYGSYSCPTNAVIPLVGKSKNSDLRSAIDTIMPAGGTAGHLGMSWAWYMLSPAWAGVLPSGSDPSNYASKETVKSVLLLSDGEFNVSYLSGPSSDEPLMTDESYRQFQDVCNSMKQLKIIVFTVGLGLTEPRAQAEMKACATSDQQHFQATTGADLKMAFKKVGLQLKQMRLTK